MCALPVPPHPDAEKGHHARSHHQIATTTKAFSPSVLARFNSSAFLTTADTFQLNSKSTDDKIAAAHLKGNPIVSVQSVQDICRQMGVWNKTAICRFMDLWVLVRGGIRKERVCVGVCFMHAEMASQRGVTMQARKANMIEWDILSAADVSCSPDWVGAWCVYLGV